MVSVRPTWYTLWVAKGKLISKGNFGFFNSSKKRTKNFCPNRLGPKFKFVFLEELKTSKREFEINWPLRSYCLLYILCLKTTFSFVALRSLVQQIILPVFYYDSLSLTTAHVLALSMPVVLCMSQSFSVFGLRHLEVFLNFLRTRPATPWFQRKSRQK